jgi:hypothetical protein
VSRCCFWSSVKILGTIFEETVIILKSSLIICRTVSPFILNFSAISITPYIRFGSIKVRTLSTFTSVLCVSGCPLLKLSCASSRPSLNHLCHSETLDYFMAAPHSCHSCFRHSIPQTHTSSSPAWERTHLVSGSCKRNLEHVQTFLGT